MSCLFLAHGRRQSNSHDFCKALLPTETTKEFTLPTTMPPTQTIDQFLSEISSIVREKNGAKLQDYLVIEPPYSNLYAAMVNEMRQNYPRGREGPFEAKCRKVLPTDEEDAHWNGFIKFMVQYFVFLRDVNIDNLLETYNALSEVVQLDETLPVLDLNS